MKEKIKKLEDWIEKLQDIQWSKEWEIREINKFIEKYYWEGNSWHHYRKPYLEGLDDCKVIVKSNHPHSDANIIKLSSIGKRGEYVWSYESYNGTNYFITEGYNMYYHSFYCTEGSNGPFESKIIIEQQGKEIDSYDLSKIIKMENKNPKQDLKDKIKKHTKQIEKIEWEIKKLTKIK